MTLYMKQKLQGKIKFAHFKDLKMYYNLRGSIIVNFIKLKLKIYESPYFSTFNKIYKINI